MSLTKKDYELIAGSLQMTDKWTAKVIRRDLFIILCENLANALNRDNPKFDRNRFLTACGIVEKCYEEHASGKYAGATPPHYHD